MSTIPRWLMLRRWIVLRFVARLARQDHDSSDQVDYKGQLADANRRAFAQWLVKTYRLNEWPAESSSTGPASSSSPPSPRRSF